MARRFTMYRLIGQTPVPVENIMELATVSADELNRRVKLTKVGPVTVSTVFLSVNHQFGDGPPILFETMAWIDMEHEAYGRKWDRHWEEYQTRCSTWLEAEEMHRRAVEHFRQYGDEVIDITDEVQSAGTEDPDGSNDDLQANENDMSSGDKRGSGSIKCCRNDPY